MRHFGKENSLTRAIQDQIKQFGLTILQHSHEVIRAVPKFIGTQLAHPEAPRIFSQTGQLLVIDIVPLMLIYGTYSLMTTPSKNSEEQQHYSIAACIGLYLIDAIAAMFILRQKLRFLAHTTVLSIAYPSELNKVTDHTRVKCNAAICKDCTQARYLKGEIRTVIVYFAQLLTLGILERIPYAGYWMAAFSRLTFTGQVISEYRLANDKICDRHRTEYFHQYPELFFTIGCFHWIATQCVASQFAWIPGLKRSDFESVIGALMMLYFVGVTHHMSLPRPVKKATRHFYDPLMMLRAIISHCMDLITPGFKKIFDNMADQKKEKLSWKNFRIQCDSIYQHRITKLMAQWVLPKMYRDYETFSNDFIMRKYWPTVLEKISDHLEKILTLRKPALKLASFIDFYRDYVVPAQEAASVLSAIMSIIALPVVPLHIVLNLGLLQRCVQPVMAVCKINALQNDANQAATFASQHNRSISDLKNIFAGVPRGVVIIIIALLRDKNFVEDLEKLRRRLMMCRHEEGSKQFEDVPVIKEKTSGFFCVTPTTQEPPVFEPGFDCVRREEGEIAVPDTCDWTVSPPRFPRAVSSFDNMSDDSPPPKLPNTQPSMAGMH